MISLFLLRRKEQCDFDEVDGFVIAAHSHKEARTIADRNAGTEFEGTWLDPEKTSCRLLKEKDQKPGVIIMDFHAG